jgi:cystathionine beta-synthase
LSKVHSDEWMRDNHLLDPEVTRVSDLAPAGSRGVPKLLSVQVSDPLRAVLALIEQYDVNQIPVFRGSEVAGTLYDSDVLKAALQNAAVLEQPAESLMAAALPVVASDVPVGEVTRLLATGTPAVLVRHGGAVSGILTRFDMLQFIVGRQ